MRKRTRVTVSLAAVCTLLGGVALTAAMSAAPALADYAPGVNDIVGDGSDTLQFIVDFAADGDVKGDPGYNDIGNPYKIVSMDATADSNARFAWQVGASLANPTAGALNPTAVYRGGTYPQLRINGSGAGINALLADTSPADPPLNFARMSSNPTLAEGATAVSNGWQGLQQFILGTENLRASADLTNNIPCDTATGVCASGQVPGLSAVELADIFEANKAGSTGSTTLSAAITASQTSITVASDTGFPSAPFTISIGSEDLTVTSVGASPFTTWTVVRGVNGTTAAAAASGATVSIVASGCLAWPGVWALAGSSAPATTSTTLTAAAAATDTSLSVASTASFPATPFNAEIGTEAVKVTSDTATSLTVSRGQYGTVAAAAANGATVSLIPSTVSNDTIIPIIPQPGSGTRSTFLTDLGNAVGLGGAQLAPGNCSTIGEENDPTAITSLSTLTTNPVDGGTCSPNCAEDAIEPFSGARLNLYSGLSGNTSVTNATNVGQAHAYFRTPATPYPNSTTNVLSPGIEQTTGTPVDGAATYTDQRNLNIVYRWTDQISTTPWQPGSSLNWAQTLFCNPGGSVTPFFQTGPGQVLIAEAGGNPVLSSGTNACLTTPLT